MSLSRGLVRAGRQAASIKSGRFARLAFLNTNARPPPPAPPASPGSPFDSSLEKAVLDSKLTSLEKAIAEGTSFVNIRRHYTEYVHRIQSSRSKGDSHRLPMGVGRMVFILARWGSPHHLALIEQVIRDCRTIFKDIHTTQMHNKIVKGLILHGNIQTLYHWLVASPKRTGQFMTIHQWRLFFEHCKELGEVGMMRQSLKTMGQSGCKPTNCVFALLLDTLLIKDPRPRSFDQVFIDAHREGLPYDESIARLVYDGFAKLGQLDRATQVAALYRAKFPESHESEVPRSRRLAMVKKESEKGIKEAISMCLYLKGQGCSIDAPMLTAALHSSTQLFHLRYAAKALRLDANIVHWSILIKNLVTLGKIPNALLVYDKSQEEGIAPDIAMVQPIINALCFPLADRPSEAAIDRALQIYRQMYQATASIDPSAVPKSSGISAPLHSQVYNTLLRTLASADDAEKYVPEAISLLKEMALQGVAMEDSSIVTSVTILLMRAAQSHDEALDIIKNAASLKHGPGLDAKGYSAVLDAFCRLSFRNLNLFPSLNHYFQIVSLMRQAGYDPTAEVYTILIRHLVQSPGVTRIDVHFAIRKVHDRLLIDTSLTPDVALWNQLMDAYQRAGSIAHAHGIWDMLFVSQQYDNASVSIIFDACAFAQEWSLASKICSWLFEVGFPLNQRNWNAWLECMCRLDRLDDAVRLACTEMGKNNHVDSAPDEDTLHILIKFAKGANRESAVLSEIKRHLPSLLDSLPDISS